MEHAFFMGPMTSVGLHGEVDPLIYVDGKYASLPPMHCFHASNWNRDPAQLAI
jgi:hypothetical protein